MLSTHTGDSRLKSLAKCPRDLQRVFNEVSQFYDLMKSSYIPQNL